VCAYANEVRRECAGRCSEDELEGILCVDFEAREFRGVVGQWGGYSSEPLAISVDIQGTKLGCGKLDCRPFKCYRGLGDVPQLRNKEYASQIRSLRVAERIGLTSSFGFSGVVRPYASRTLFCNAQNSASRRFSSLTFWCTAILTIDPVVAPGGRSIEGNSIKWARSPSSICSRCQAKPEVWAI
jgi:hypothetical protein